MDAGIAIVGSAVGMFVSLLVESIEVTQVENTNTRSVRSAILISISLLVLPSVVATIFFGYESELDAIDSFYMAIVTASTVGYGDNSPQADDNNTQRIFSVFWILVAVFATGTTASDPYILIS